MATKYQLEGNSFYSTWGGRRFGQRITINDTITNLYFLIWRYGAHTGDVIFTIRKVSDDAILGSKVWGDASALPTSGHFQGVTFDTPIVVNEEVRICCEFSPRVSGHMVRFWFNNSNVVDGENYCQYYSTSWADQSGDCVYIYNYVAHAVTTQPVTNVRPESATGNGNMTSLGDPGTTQHGHCWATFPNPTTAHGKTQNGIPGATGPFTSDITGLAKGRKYYCRAYATNVVGTSYGAEVEFTPLARDSTVITDPATSLEKTAATLNGTLDDDGNEACDCGFEYGETTAYGTITSTEKKETGETFSQAISGLTPGKHYHFRAIATNSAGTSYGSDRQFFAKGGVKGNPNIEQRIYQHVERMER